MMQAWRAGSVAAWLGALLLLFVLRVIGQVVAGLSAPRWLPPFRAWYSGVMPYRYLLPAQLLLIGLMVLVVRGVRVGPASGFLGTPRPALGVWVVVASAVYALGMVVRLWRWVSLPPERRGVFIPIVFHFVLAGFLFVYGSWHRAAALAGIAGTR